MSIWGRSRPRTSLTRVTGSRAPPGTRRFWAARAAGAGTQTLVWPVEDGDWSVVVMNADGSPGVRVHLSAGAKVAFVFRVGLGLAIGGALLLILGIVLIVLGARLGRRAPPPAPPAPAAPAAPAA